MVTLNLALFANGIFSINPQPGQARAFPLLQIIREFVRIFGLPPRVLTVSNLCCSKTHRHYFTLILIPDVVSPKFVVYRLLIPKYGTKKCSLVWYDGLRVCMTRRNIQDGLSHADESCLEDQWVEAWQNSLVIWAGYLTESVIEIITDHRGCRAVSDRTEGFGWKP